MLTDLRAAPVRGGTETILVVEDDDEVREAAVALLSELGYRVIEAHDATSALNVIESGLEIDLLFTDVVMSGPLRSRAASVPSPHVETPPTKVANIARWTVLSVEDDDIIRSTADMLTGLGHTVREATDARSALTMLEADVVDILVTGVGLPDISGTELARRALEIWQNLGVVFATGDDAVSSEQDLKSAVLLVKPYAEEDLAQALASAIARSRLAAAE